MIKIGDNTAVADLGFYINLAKREDRKRKIVQNLTEYRITGVNRWEGFYDTKSPQRGLFNTTLDIYKHFLKTDNKTLLILEDDCEFLPILKTDYNKIFNEINLNTWDLFWLGCLHRKPPKLFSDRCYIVSSVSYAQSYIITRNMAEHIVDFYSGKDWIKFNTGVDEMLTLFTYNEDIATDPWKYSFYEQPQPLDVFTPKYKAMCHFHCLTTQYTSYSDLWKEEKSWGWKIKNTHPETKEW